MDLMNWSLIVSDFVLHWVIQSSLLILGGLVATRLLRKRGAAFASGAAAELRWAVGSCFDTSVQSSRTSLIEGPPRRASCRR